MAVLKIYSIQNDITAQAADIVKLYKELDTASCINSFECIDNGSGETPNTDEIIINGASFSDETAANNIISNHEPESLSELKERRWLEIDVKSVQLISAGFTFDSESFSLSSNARENWNSIKVSKLDFTFPLDITTTDNNTYSLDTDDVQAFWTAARDAVKGHLDSGRVLKKSIFDAVDKAAVDAIVDNR